MSVDIAVEHPIPQAIEAYIVEAYLEEGFCLCVFETTEK
jgi:hypothetical protein